MYELLKQPVKLANALSAIMTQTSQSSPTLTRVMLNAGALL
jgi:hypothetical protein